MAKPNKILLVEDDKFISRAYKDGLERAGFVVTVVSGGQESIAKIQSEHPNLVLLDIMLPMKNGFEVLSEMKMDEDLKNIPVIILSNLGQESDIQKGTDLGAVDYLIKSNLTMKQVIAKIKEHLTKVRRKK